MLASGSHQSDAIVISDDEDGARQAHQEQPPSTIVPRNGPSQLLGRQVFPIIDHPADKVDQPALLSPPIQSAVHLPSRAKVEDEAGTLSTFGGGQQFVPSSIIVQPEGIVDLCPYYLDDRFELVMYRGPGYTKFHVVLESSDACKVICQDWDERRRRQTSCRMPHSNMVEEERCLEQVLLVFPRVQHEFVRKTFREHYPGAAYTVEELTAANAHIAGFIIAHIAEMESFPTQKSLKRKRSNVLRENGEQTISWNKAVRKDGTYQKESLILLANEFARIPTYFIHNTLQEKGALFETFLFLAESERTYSSAQRRLYNRYRLGRVTLEKKYQRRSFEQRKNSQYVNIVNEFQAARQWQCREETQGRLKRAEEQGEAINFAEHQLQGSLMDCACCYNEVPINRVVHCENDETHFFCKRCIVTRAKDQIGSLKHKMTCMDTSGCGAELSKDALERALATKLLDKLAEIQQLVEIRAANLDGLEQCPFCDFQAICAAVDIDTTFQCLAPDCEKMSCRKCKEESHLPKTCEEQRKANKGLSARHAIEEARSEAMMRSCPKCGVKIIKSDGCNKMTCSTCRTVMCYVCKQDISGRNYQHFSSNHTSKCPLWELSVENRHQKEADDAEKAAIAAVKARDANVIEDDLRIGAHLKCKSTESRAIVQAANPL